MIKYETHGRFSLCPHFFRREKRKSASGDTKATSPDMNVRDGLSSHLYGFLETRHFFPLPFGDYGQRKEISRTSDCASRERRVHKGHATKPRDWRGLCSPEPRRLDGDNMNVREAVNPSKEKRLRSCFCQGHSYLERASSSSFASLYFSSPSRLTTSFLSGYICRNWSRYASSISIALL